MTVALMTWHERQCVAARPAGASRTLVDADAIALTAAVLSRRVPRATVWFGAYTRRWWAVVPDAGGWRLVEAPDPEELARRITHARGRPGPGAAMASHA